MPKCGNLQRRRIHVVGALAHVDVFVGVQVLVLAPRVAEVLERKIGDDLVRVHVGRGASPALDHVHHELGMQPSCAYFLAGCNDGVGSLLVEQSELVVGERRRLLDRGQRPDQVRIDRYRIAGDREVFDGTQRVYAVIDACRDGAVAEQIVLDAGWLGRPCRSREVVHSVEDWPMVSKIDSSCGLMAMPRVLPDGSLRMNHCS